MYLLLSYETLIIRNDLRKQIIRKHMRKTLRKDAFVKTVTARAPTRGNGARWNEHLFNRGAGQSQGAARLDGVLRNEWWTIYIYKYYICQVYITPLCVFLSLSLYIYIYV